MFCAENSPTRVPAEEQIQTAECLNAEKFSVWVKSKSNRCTPPAFGVPIMCMIWGRTMDKIVGILWNQGW